MRDPEVEKYATMIGTRAARISWGNTEIGRLIDELELHASDPVDLARMIDTRARRNCKDSDELRRIAARLLETCDTTEPEDTHEHRHEARSPVPL